MKEVLGLEGKYIYTEPDEKTVKYSFKQYAAYCIDNAIREEINNG
jgi:hypothetical protein